MLRSIAEMLNFKRLRLSVTVSFVTFFLTLIFFNAHIRLPALSNQLCIGAGVGCVPDVKPPPTVTNSSSSNKTQLHSTSADENDPKVFVETDWSRFAYTQYVTNSQYLCNSVMIFEALWWLGSKADRLLLYPRYMADPNGRSDRDDLSDDAWLVYKARDEYGVKLQPIDVWKRESNDSTWAESYTKLLVFNQTQYARVLLLDSDSSVLQPMDELFLLPPCRVAMPRAYWLYPDDKILSSQIMLVTPSAAEFARIVNRTEKSGSKEYDMDIMNALAADSALVLPHRRYDLLTAEFRSENHTMYLGSDDEVWDAVTIYNEASFLHFSDWPVPKPWIDKEPDMLKDFEPTCNRKNKGLRPAKKEEGEDEEENDGRKEKSCTERKMWHAFYAEFKSRRERVCGRLPRPARH